MPRLTGPPRLLCRAPTRPATPRAPLRRDVRRSSTASTGGPLAGWTIGVKDNIVSATDRTSAGSRALEKYTSPFDATVVALLRAHGAEIVAGQKMDEFGMGSHSQHTHLPPATNPYVSEKGEALSPGGSSGGGAVAVATGEVRAALGTDTGGSVRLPAAYTGTVGFKPSYGRVSRWGVVAYANSLDTVGVLGTKVEDVRRVFAVLDRYDERDPTSLPPRVRARIMGQSTTGPGREDAEEGGGPEPKRQKRLRIGIPAEYNIAEISPLVRRTYARALRALQEGGHTLVPVSLPSTRLALSAYYVLAPAEAASNLAKYDGVRYGYRASSPPSSSTKESSVTADADPAANLPLYAATRSRALGAEVRRRILLGAYTLSADARDNYFVQAQRVRRMVAQDFDRVFRLRNPLVDAPASSAGHQSGQAGGGVEGGGVDVLLTPTAPTLPPTIASLKTQTPTEGYMNDVFTVPASLAGLPALSLPARLDGSAAKGPDGPAQGSGRTIDVMGLQVLGQFGDDDGVLDAAGMIEELLARS